MTNNVFGLQNWKLHGTIDKVWVGKVGSDDLPIMHSKKT